MLPANLAKSRAAGARGLGELLMVSPHAAAAAAGCGSGMLQTLRYSPYSVPVSTNTMVAAFSHHQQQSAANFSATNVTQTSPLPQHHSQTPLTVYDNLNAVASSSNSSSINLANSPPPPPSAGLAAAPQHSQLSYHIDFNAALAAAAAKSAPPQFADFFPTAAVTTTTTQAAALFDNNNKLMTAAVEQQQHQLPPQFGGLTAAAAPPPPNFLAADFVFPKNSVLYA